MNNFFSNDAINLDVDRELHTDKINAGDPVTILIDKYKTNPSIEKISRGNFPSSNFTFKHISESNMLEAFKDFDFTKSFQLYNIPPKDFKG